MTRVTSIRWSDEEVALLEAVAGGGESVGRVVKRLVLEAVGPVGGGRVEPVSRAAVRRSGKAPCAAARASLEPGASSVGSRPAPAAPRSAGVAISTLRSRLVRELGSDSLGLRALRLGQVTVDGRVVRDPDHLLPPDAVVRCAG